MPQTLPTDDIGLDDIQTFDAFCKRYPDITNEARLRWWIYHRASNGLEKSGAIVKRAGWAISCNGTNRFPEFGPT